MTRSVEAGPGVAVEGRRPLRSPAAVMLLLAVVAMVLTVLVAGPGSASPDADELGDVGALGDADAGREVFAANCAACHGAAGDGRGSAPSLVEVADRHTVAQIETVIREGRGGMPAFDARLDDGQIDDVIAHLAQLPEDESVAPRRGPHMDRGWDDMMWDGMPGVFMLVWLVFGILLIALLVAGIVWLVRSVSSDGGRRQGGTSSFGSPSSGAPSSGAGSAREDLDQRYARGELSREEYRQIREDLEGH